MALASALGMVPGLVPVPGPASGLARAWDLDLAWVWALENFHHVAFSTVQVPHQALQAELHLGVAQG